MKKELLLCMGMMLGGTASPATPLTPLTPRPKHITMGEGVYTLPATVTISTGALKDSLVREAEKLARVLATSTGRRVVIKPAAKADIVMRLDNGITAPEGYRLTVAADGVVAEASTTAGFFYAFQTLKKLMPPCVMAGVRDETVTQFTAPLCTIDDEPRFQYRGYMLDVSRHYFSVDQIKRMLDIMAWYKLNTFHWHLTDDQGWRIEVKRYPRLTTTGATRDYSYEVDPLYGRYRTCQPYGPFYYTQEEAREIVRYAADLHIEVIPEVDMPGHMVAAMAAYPEFSCTPDQPHAVWCDGGISADVLNVADPRAVQFARDVMSELATVFPSRHFHIGGDECPTDAWKANAACRQLYDSLGLEHYRALQSRFIRQMDEHARSLGKHLFMWNESISAPGADQDVVQATDATIMCWTGAQAAALTAARRGLKAIVTPWGPYYINRVQSTRPGEPYGAGNGADTPRSTYEYVPVPADLPDELASRYIGVQGTFWCEHVGSPYLLEYLSLPRLICVAEAGWTPQHLKDWDHFLPRWQADTQLLDYKGYRYWKEH